MGARDEEGLVKRVNWSRRRWSAALTVLVVGGLAVTACSSSSGSGGTAAGSGSTSSGAPITFGIIYPVNSQIYSVPGPPRAAQVAVKAINAAGGVNGHPIKVVACDDQTSPSVSTQCINSLVKSDNIVSLLASNSYETATWYPILAANKVPAFGIQGGDPTTGTSPQAYPTNYLSAFSSFNLLANSATHKVACLANSTAIGIELCQLPADTLKKKGIDVKIITYQSSTTDYTPYLSIAKSYGADTVIMANASPVNNVIMSNMIQLGYKANVWVNEGGWDETTLSSATKANIPLRTLLTYCWSGSDCPARDEYKAEVAKYDPSLPAATSETTVNAWVWVHEAAEVAKQLPDVSRDSFTAYIKSHPLSPPMMHPNLTYYGTPPLKSSQWSRVYNTWVIPATLQNGTWAQDPSGWLNYAPSLNTAVAGS
jgi:branched-chain amino acid transport system substrate-binding protein